MTYKAGDIVRLKSNPFPMVAGVVSHDQRFVKCFWQNVTSGGAEPRECVYPVEVLERVGTGTEAPAPTPSSERAPLDDTPSWARSSDDEPNLSVPFDPEPALPEFVTPEPAPMPPAEPEPQPVTPPRRPSWLGSRT